MSAATPADELNDDRATTPVATTFEGVRHKSNGSVASLSKRRPHGRRRRDLTTPA